MTVYRISQSKYSEKLTASGAENRWNKQNEYVIYTSGSRALATLEIVAYRSAKMKKQGFVLICIDIPNAKKYYTEVLEKNLPTDWKSLKRYNTHQLQGSIWYGEQASLILKVPSVLVANEHNYVINTKHPDFVSRVSIIKVEKFIWDSILL